MSAEVRHAWFEPVGKRKCCSLAIPCTACTVLLYGDIEPPSPSSATVGSPTSTPVIRDAVVSSLSPTVVVVPLVHGSPLTSAALSPIPPSSSLPLGTARSSPNPPATRSP
ncbi:hypothetical protein EDD85DRAFT_958024 [Armillaria nabsnona]|nr:hypothetical protein EDD85DRAFT_958024 [Armillaria nabsnona]